MPGILPMKVIKVGSSTQARIAQACDRCRSKKIRCDGLRPCCSQCSSVGFECKTSDKLSRRAFPRGYTESLEERVRGLELEVRELKELLDERDEKIEVLSKMHSYSPRGSCASMRQPSGQRTFERQASGDFSKDRQDGIKLHQPPYLVNGDDTEAFYTGASGTRTLLDSFQRKLQESGRQCSQFNVDAFTQASHIISTSSSRSHNFDSLRRPPPRLLSDQMVNIYFQEWAPLFPVLYRPSFLRLYEQFVNDSSAIQNQMHLLQLNLVFSIAAVSNKTRLSMPESLEAKWRPSLEAISAEGSLDTLQCYILAQLFYIQTGDMSRLTLYRGLAVGLAQRLGLHLSQKRFSLGVLTSETRKKVFWTLYTIDCFSAASLGLPKLLKDQEIFCEFPADTDDEYVTETGFQPTLPGESTKLSSALALFRGARVLSRVLEGMYSPASSGEMSFKKIAAFSDELDEWAENLAPHLRLEFVQDKPSTHIITSRCPLLSLTYHYIQILIHRPIICADLGERSSSSLVTIAQSSKRIVQIVQLLKERNLSFSHCINKNELLVICGFGLLYQAIDLDKDTKLLKDSQRMICTVIGLLDERKAPGAAEFRQIGCSMISLEGAPKLKSDASPQRSASTPRITGSSRLCKKDSSLSPSLDGKSASLDEGRSATAPMPSTSGTLHKASGDITSGSLAPYPSIKVTPSLGNRVAVLSKDGPQKSNSPLSVSPKSSSNSNTPNLDYFSFPDDQAPNARSQQNDQDRRERAIWDKALDVLGDHAGAGSGNQNIYDIFQDWSAANSLLSPPESYQPSGPPSIHASESSHWSPDLWAESSIDSLQKMVHQQNPLQPNRIYPHSTRAPQSVLSLSDESLVSIGDEFGAIDVGGSEKAFTDIGGVDRGEDGFELSHYVVPT